MKKRCAKICCRLSTPRPAISETICPLVSSFLHFPQSTRTNEPGEEVEIARLIMATWFLTIRQLFADSEMMVIFRSFRFCWYSSERSPLRRTSNPAASAALATHRS